MSNTIPKFLQNKVLPEDYYAEPNPYIDQPSCNVNLRQLSRYARKMHKKLVDLTEEEVEMFSIKRTDKDS
ncbi:MAG: hypothetical protein LUF92_16010 [Clostridiales bacterium]|nr:hypothetical protein [Clostridiales bacterium]